MAGKNFEIRPINPDEFAAYQAIGNYAFADNTAEDKRQPPPMEPEWTLAGFDGDKLVASSGAFPFKMRFNGNAVAADGVTMVATNPGYRRQGLVREMMTRLLERSRENDVPISILWASMGAIYQRFGYGLASTDVVYEVDPRYVQFQLGASPKGQVRLLEKDDALDHCKAVYRAFSAERTLLLHRAPVLWDILFRREQDQYRYAAVYFDDKGEPRGYAVYATKWLEGREVTDAQLMEILDFAWADMDGYRGVWEYMAAHDLVSKIRWWRVPEDDPAPGMFLEPRMLRRRTGDGIWLRVVDVEAALAARNYDVPGEVTLRLAEDDLCPWNVGTYRVSTTGEATEVERTDANADLEVTPNGLASLISGHSSASYLHRIGRLRAEDVKALPVYDSVFATRYKPNCTNGF